MSRTEYTWGQICDMGLADKVAWVKGVPLGALFENLNSTDKMILSKQELNRMGIVSEQFPSPEAQR